MRRLIRELFSKKEGCTPPPYLCNPCTLAGVKSIDDIDDIDIDDRFIFNKLLFGVKLTVLEFSCKVTFNKSNTFLPFIAVASYTL